jgi:putative ABC transport system permease protein
VNLLRLAWKNILGNGYRSVVVLICAALVSGLALSATFVVRGAEASLRTNLRRLGADILVLPWGTMTDKIGGARLMSAAIDGWMPRAAVDKVAAIDGVARVSPQLYVGSIHDAVYCTGCEMSVVAYAPDTDFVLRAWLEDGRAQHLAAGEAVIGSQITIPEDGDEIPIYGHRLHVVNRLEPTATSIDSTVFVTFETAEAMIAWSEGQAKGRLNLMPGSISAIMVKVALDADPHRVAVEILEHVPGVVPLETPDLFQSERRQMAGVLRTMLGLLGLVWAITLVFLGMVFSVGANARRWDIGVLRALGFPRALVLKVLLTEGAMLALMGGLVGISVAIAGFTALGDEVVRMVGLPLQVPSVLGLVSLSLGGQAVALFSVTSAAFVPAWRISHEEVALTVRE